MFYNLGAWKCYNLRSVTKQSMAPRRRDIKTQTKRHTRESKHSLKVKQLVLSSSESMIAKTRTDTKNCRTKPGPNIKTPNTMAEKQQSMPFGLLSNDFLSNGDFCLLLITCVNSLDPDQFDVPIVFLKEFFEKLIFEKKISRRQPIC